MDANVKICLVTAGESNIEVLRELFPTRSIGCFINKPVSIEYLVSKIIKQIRIKGNVSLPVLLNHLWKKFSISVTYHPLKNIWQDKGVKDSNNS